MPTINLEALTPKIIGETIAVLRENSITANFVNTDFSADMAGKGDSVDVPIPNLPQVVDVQAGIGNIGVDDASDIIRDKVNVPLDYWKKVRIEFTDKKLHEFLSRGVSEEIMYAGKALADDLDRNAQMVMGQGLNLLSNVPDPLTDPVAQPTDPTVIFEARRLLNENSIPMAPRNASWRPKTAEKLLVNDKLRRYDQSGRMDVLADAMLGRFGGFDHYESNNIYLHTAGAVTDTGADATAGATAVNSTSITVSGSNISGTFKKGDHLQISGFADPFVITADGSFSANSATISIAPKLTSALTGSETVTFVQKSGYRNLAFHRDALALAIRPLSGGDMFTGGNLIQTVTDDLSGISMRLEVYRQNKATIWEIDLLYGLEILRPNAGSLILDTAS